MNQMTKQYVVEIVQQRKNGCNVYSSSLPFTRNGVTDDIGGGREAKCWKSRLAYEILNVVWNCIKDWICTFNQFYRDVNQNYSKWEFWERFISEREREREKEKEKEKEKENEKENEKEKEKERERERERQMFKGSKSTISFAYCGSRLHR